MSENISMNVKLDKGSISFKAIHNKKFQTAVLFVEFKTSQTSLLSLLLQKYTMEKRLFTGVNINNGIHSIITGEKSIMMLVPENKITQNISLLYTYLLKSHLTSQQTKLCGTGDYDKLSTDISNFNVIVTGKCKNFINALKNNTPKIVNMINQINATSPKNRSSFNVSTFDSDINKYITLSDMNNNALIYLAICVEDIPCVISKDKIKFLSKNGRACFNEKMSWKDAFQGKIKSFLNQTGAVGSPSANDVNGAKYKEKIEKILQCENMLATIISKLHGFQFTFSNVDELKKIDSNALNKIKSIRIE